MPTPAELLKEHGLSPKKSWGQNFLTDPRALDRIVAACDLSPEDTVVVEIGAGTGVLTERLIGEGRTVWAVERDRDLVRLLSKRFADQPGLRLLEMNALDLDLTGFSLSPGERIKVIGNLPYHLTAPILFLLLAHRRALRSAHVMIQKEVARRILATPGGREYGLLSVLLGRIAHFGRRVEVGRGSFLPPPQVDSTFMSLSFKPDSNDPFTDEFFTSFVKASFHHRRKTLLNSLSQQPFFEMSHARMAAFRERFEDRLALRAETLSVEQYVEMAAFLAAQP